MSAYFETHLPSYYGDTFFWEEATIISLGDAANAYDINLVPAEGAFDGECWIDGNLVGDNFKGQLDNENVTLILLDENNNPLEVTYSQANSAFDFSNINYGTYTVYAEITGLPTEPATITLTADNPNAEVTIEVSANGATTGLGDMPSKYVEEIGAIYPNPINTQAQIHMIMKQQSALTIHIYNQLGQLVQTRTITAQEGTSVLQIQTDNLSNGVYNLQIMTDDGASFIQKFIK
ncbi:MAG: hypothetical protein B7C24_10305 [Bacteroidetes bacterium 4572_77]|nr:MAG: hypothetical protein B7C24_10305 [Bacteroidetes bacterium 4572_77]